MQFDHPAEATRAGIALVTEDRKRLGLFANLDVGENITVCTLDEAAPGGLVRWGRQRQMAEDVVRELGVKTAGTEAAITSLSGGNQQKAIIGRWLLTRPKVLLLDDPTRGVDVGRQGGAVSADGSALPRRAGDHRHVERAARAVDAVRPHPGAVRGAANRRVLRAEATEQRIMEAATQRIVGQDSDPDGTRIVSGSES